MISLLKYRVCIFDFVSTWTYLCRSDNRDPSDVVSLLLPPATPKKDPAVSRNFSCTRRSR